VLAAALVCLVLATQLYLIGVWVRYRAEVDLSTSSGVRIHRSSPRRITVIPRTEWGQRIRAIEAHKPPPRHGRHSSEHLLTSTVEMIGLPDLLSQLKLSHLNTWGGSDEASDNTVPGCSSSRGGAHYSGRAGRYLWLA
jgi:hypothetical protein